MFGSVGLSSLKLALMQLPDPVIWLIDAVLGDPSVQTKQVNVGFSVFNAVTIGAELPPTEQMKTVGGIMLHSISKGGYLVLFSKKQ